METVMRYRGKAVTDEEVVFIREFIAQNSGDSRWMLSRKLCQAWDWRQPNGALRDMVCRGLMLHLARAGQIELPPIRIRIVNPLVHRKKPARVEIDRTPMEGKLSDLGPLVVILFFSSRRRHTRLVSDWSSDVCSSDLMIRHTRLVSDWSSDVCSSD